MSFDAGIIIMIDTKLTLTLYIFNRYYACTTHVVQSIRYRLPISVSTRVLSEYIKFH